MSADRLRMRSSPGRAALLALGAAVGLAGCATRYNFKTEEIVLDAARVADAGTYAFGATEAAAPPVQTPDEQVVDREIRAALTHELDARGWTPVTPDAADVVVSYAIGSSEGASLISDAFLGRYSTYNADAARELAYVDQALVVDLQSKPSGESIWRGQAVARLYGPMGEARTEVINQAVARIIAQLDDDL